MTHSYTIEKVQMWVRNHDNVVKALDYRETVCKLTIVNYVALTSDSADKLVFLDLTFEHSIDIVNVESTGISFASYLCFIFCTILLKLTYLILSCLHSVTYYIQVALVN